MFLLLNPRSCPLLQSLYLTPFMPLSVSSFSHSHLSSAHPSPSILIPNKSAKKIYVDSRVLLHRLLRKKGMEYILIDSLIDQYSRRCTLNFDIIMMRACIVPTGVSGLAGLCNNVFVNQTVEYEIWLELLFPQNRTQQDFHTIKTIKLLYLDYYPSSINSQLQDELQDLVRPLHDVCNIICSFTQSQIQCHLARAIFHNGNF